MGRYDRATPSDLGPIDGNPPIPERTITIDGNDGVRAVVMGHTDTSAIGICAPEPTILLVRGFPFLVDLETITTGAIFRLDIPALVCDIHQKRDRFYEVLRSTCCNASFDLAR